MGLFLLHTLPLAKTKHFWNYSHPFKVPQLPHFLLSGHPFPPSVSCSQPARPGLLRVSLFRCGLAERVLGGVRKSEFLSWLCSSNLSFIITHFQEPMDILYFPPLNILSLSCLHITVLLVEGLPSCGICQDDHPLPLPCIYPLLTFLTRGCGTSDFIPRPSLGQTQILTAPKENMANSYLMGPLCSRYGSPDRIWSQNQTYIDYLFLHCQLDTGLAAPAKSASGCRLPTLPGPHHSMSWFLKHNPSWC